MLWQVSIVRAGEGWGQHLQLTPGPLAKCWPVPTTSIGLECPGGVCSNPAPFPFTSILPGLTRAAFWGSPFPNASNGLPWEAQGSQCPPTCHVYRVLAGVLSYGLLGTPGREDSLLELPS